MPRWHPQHLCACEIGGLWLPQVLESTQPESRGAGFQGSGAASLLEKQSTGNVKEPGRSAETAAPAVWRGEAAEPRWTMVHKAPSPQAGGGKQCRYISNREVHGGAQVTVPLPQGEQPLGFGCLGLGVL